MAISEKFIEETVDTVHERMMSQVGDDIDKREGSVVWDLTRPASLEFAEVYRQLDNVLTFGFATENTPSNFLDLRCAELGVYRKPAVKAAGQVTFSGADGLIIPAGIRVSTDETEPVYFVTTAEVQVVDGTATATVEAELGGSNGNVAAGKIALALGEVSGVVEVTNVLPFDGGVDEESDESLLSRYYERVQKPATSGNANHYLQWAKSIVGVGDARVYPLWNGPGTVKVVLIDTDKTTPPQSTINEVTQYIESVRPLGANVTVVGAEEVAINVSATLTLASDTTVEVVVAQFTDALRAYLKGLAYTGELIRYTRIANLLLDIPRIIDYQNLTVNGGTANIELTGDQVGVVGAVTFT